jgi:STE24 endopeptidase
MTDPPQEGGHRREAVVLAPTRRPACPGTPLDEHEERLCARYGRVKLGWALAELVVLLATLVGLTLTGAAGVIVTLAHNVTCTDPACSGASHTGWVQVMLYLAIVGLIARLAVLPIHFTNGHWIERRYGLSRQSAPAWLADWLRATALFGGLAVLFLTPVVITMHWWPLLMLPWLAAFFTVRALYYQYLYLPILSLFHPVRYLRAESFFLPGIGRRIMPVYEVEVGRKTRRCNACVIMSRGSGSVLVTDTLVDEFSDAEEKVAIAHEFGHLYDRLFLEERTSAGLAQARRKLWFAGGGWLGAALFGLCAVQWMGSPLGLHVDDLAAFPLEIALVLALGQLLSPLINAESRIDECEADEYALKITRDVDSYFSVMNKLRRINLEESCPSPLDRLLYGTHPTYLERLQIGLNFQRRASRKTRSRGTRSHPDAGPGDEKPSGGASGSSGDAP